MITGEPPLFTGGVNEIVASAFPTATDNAVGAFGIVDGVTELEAVDRADEPIPFAADTLKV